MTAVSPIPSASELHDDSRHRTVLGRYRQYIQRSGRESRFLVCLSFLLTFLIVRFITYSIRYHWFSVFRDVETRSGLHIHHLVYEIILLLVVGYCALAFPEVRGRRLIASSLLYGSGAALTLDEFALWLRLEDVYWARDGRESIDRRSSPFPSSRSAHPARHSGPLFGATSSSRGSRIPPYIKDKYPWHAACIVAVGSCFPRDS
jgi:hypothetical protein